MPSQMFKRFDNSFTIDRLVEMALIDSPRNRQPYSSRKHATAIGDSSQFGWTTRRLATLKTAQAAEPLATRPIGNCRTADTKLVRDLSFRQTPFFQQFSTCQSSFFNLLAGKLFGDPCHNLIVKQL